MPPRMRRALSRMFVRVNRSGSPITCKPMRRWGGLINPDSVEGVELVEGSPLFAPGSVRSLFPLLRWFECKRGGSECKGGQGGTGIFFLRWVPSHA